MSVGLLLLTHEGAAQPFVPLVQRLLGRLPLRIESFELRFDADLDATLPQASAALRRADSGDGVLILTDLYGASPSNLAARLTQLGTPARRVAGLNLPMLLRACNYPDQTLDELALTAAHGGKTGVVLDHA
ncbi:MAG: PTS fructose IIA subunit family protein [Chiayiivirga sp.]|jgi:PTS system mannose-specific IIA component|nr:PTS fructose IIA subunit family protein [Chiayiivirga sp.]